jgi:tetratricopeptide (TPR) repeat protein
MTEGSVDRALELFEEAAKMDGPLKLQARLQQALAQNRLGKQGEAILLYDVILRGEPPAEVRFAALSGKAANLAELGEKDPASREQALELYSKLAAEPDLGVTWRSQALYQKGRLLEALERPEEALAAYYDVLEAGLAKPEEYYWFYKAGSEAVRLCEARGQWKSAIAIYRKMAALEGPLAEDAGKRASELRLKHFIWE